MKGLVVGSTLLYWLSEMYRRESAVVSIGRARKNTPHCRVPGQPRKSARAGASGGRAPLCLRLCAAALVPAGLGLLATPFVGLSLGSQTAKTSTADQSSP